ncbi:unnamed protein product [Polarella glacialis]|uniref:PDZ domain-containing protein n=1 Tax=Polarella glacialis TaxID=89957 RepID=A0A813H788_POLGL|nr:unnamed protein product [Polarella glacialis]
MGSTSSMFASSCCTGDRDELVEIDNFQIKPEKEEEQIQGEIKALAMLSMPAGPGRRPISGDMLPMRALSSNTGGLYQIQLHRVAGSSLGLSIDFDQGLTVLPVAALNQGLAERWNQSCPPHCQVRPGDSIVQVNGIKGDAGLMLAACQNDAVLDITLQRGSSS